MAELIQVGPALSELRNLIATVDQRIADFADQSQEAEASLVESQKALVAEAKEQLEKTAHDAAAGAAAEAISQVEATRASFDSRVAEIEAKLIAVEQALSVDLDGDGRIGSVNLSSPALVTAPQINAPIQVPSGQASPRLAELIETVEAQARRINILERAGVWNEHFNREMCVAMGLKYEFIETKANAREGRNAAAE